MRTYSRRGFFGLAATSAAALAVTAVSHSSGTASSSAPDTHLTPPPAPATPTEPAPPPTPQPPAPEPQPEPKPEPPDTPPPERIDFDLMPGTEFATPCVVHHASEPGPAVMVLGGVHGDEPGSWVAAEAIAGWEVARGTLIVAPRVNHLAAGALARTFDDLGDLNRLYPGDPAGRPMARMAHEIVTVAREYEVEYLVDLHESWGFYVDRRDDRDGMYLGQLVVAGGSDAQTAFMQDVVNDVNPGISKRERLIVRDRHHGGWGFIGQGRSSISLGAHLPGCTPVLVEMAQHEQPEQRRAELHEMFVAGLLERLDMS